MSIRHQIVKLVQQSYDEGNLDNDVVRASIVESPMGNLAVSILDKNKHYLWGMNKEELFEQLQSEAKKEIKIDEALYQEVERPYFKQNGEISKPSS